MDVWLREKGRITIPMSIRKALGLREGDRLKLSVKQGAIVLKPERAVTAKEIEGILGSVKVKIEEVEEALSGELS